MPNAAYQLVTKLRELNKSEKEYRTENFFIADEDSLVKEIINLSYDALITREGQANLTAMGFVEKHVPGLSIYPGERDSFGWLVGCIRTDKGIITFG